MRLLKILFLAISLIGFLDASYLTIKHYQGEAPPCAIFSGCDIVTTSKYAKIFGIPVALLGALYYLAIFVSAILYLDFKKDTFIKLAAGLAGLGFLFSLYLVYLQIFIIKALCLYCIISATSSTLLFLISLIILKGNQKVAAKYIA